MRLSLSILLLAATTTAFTPVPTHTSCRRTALFSTEAATMADSGKPPAHSDEDAHVKDDVEIPTKLPSDVGMDYVPLATMLATGQLAEADQVRFMFICWETSEENESDYVL